MASVCFCIQIHQPYRLRRYSVFDTQPTYFNDPRNRQVIAQLAEDCYLPTAQMLLGMIQKSDGRFRVGLSLSGSAIQQFQDSCAEMVTLLEQLAETGCVEFIGETYYHSLTFLYSRDEFKAQVQLHADLLQDLFGQTPRVFRNTELIYSNELASCLGSLGLHHGVLAEGVDRVLGDRKPNRLYTTPSVPSIKLLLRNARLSEDIAARFSREHWDEWPLTADKFAQWINQAQGEVCNLLVGCEAFGQYHRAKTGIFDFLASLPGAVLKSDSNDFKTPSQCIEAFEATESYDAPFMTSWADMEKDLSAWTGNAMQSNALHELYKLEAPVKAAADPQLLTDWRRLTASDHLYYMSTKYFIHDEAHRYFNPYESPYDAYINFMNVLDNLRSRT